MTSTFPHSGGKTGRQFYVVLPPTLESVAMARRALVRSARRWGCAEAVCADAALVVSELVTNAVLHARTPTKLLVQSSGDGMRIEVSDTSPEPLLARPSLPPRPVAPLEDSDELAALEAALGDVTMTGRGLALVAALAGSWGVTDQAAGKTVWAQIGPGTPTGDSPARISGEQGQGERVAGSGPGASGASRPLQLIAVPVRLMVASDRNFDDLLRELQVVALDTRAPEPSISLAELAADVIDQLGSLERQGRQAVREAIERGDRLVDLNLYANDLVPAGFSRLSLLLRMVAQEVQAGRLLTGAPADEVVAFRR
ncbi:MAG: ATP-binding protein [Acidimicrobiales bacterium]